MNKTDLIALDLYDKKIWTVGSVLENQALCIPDKPMITLEGASISYGDAFKTAGQVANFLTQAGVEKGDYVGVMLPNRLEYCCSWFGLSLMGAVHVAINTDYKGRFLSHVLNNSQSRFMIIDAEYIDRIDEISSDLEFLEQVFIVGGGNRSQTFRSIDFEGWRKCDPGYTGPCAVYRDSACVMYTSGTTGVSKGVLMPHAHLYLFGLGTIENMDVCGDDVFYIVLPLFHANGMLMQLYASMIAGAHAFIRGRFSASSWIDDVVGYGVTITNSLGVIAAFILNQPASKLDRKHKLRVMGMAPISAEQEMALKERFGIPRVVGMYGMTEVNIPLYTKPDCNKPGSCGAAWERFFEVEIVDSETDELLPAGEIGEIVVRPKQSWGFMSGYLNMPDKTIEAVRNFWFHTGDAASMDDEGYVYFVDRIKDCIRRRGENISSFEVETALCGHEEVDEVAAYAVDCEIEGGEDEVMVAVVRTEGCSVTAAELSCFAETALPTFAMPRYYRFMSQLPKTPTGKVQKHLLRKDGAEEADWENRLSKAP